VLDWCSMATRAMHAQPHAMHEPSQGMHARGEAEVVGSRDTHPTRDPRERTDASTQADARRETRSAAARHERNPKTQAQFKSTPHVPASRSRALVEPPAPVRALHVRALAQATDEASVEEQRALVVKLPLTWRQRGGLYQPDGAVAMVDAKGGVHRRQNYSYHVERPTTVVNRG